MKSSQLLKNLCRPDISGYSFSNEGGMPVKVLKSLGGTIWLIMCSVYGLIILMCAGVSHSMSHHHPSHG